MMSDSPNEEVPSRNATCAVGVNGEFTGNSGLVRPKPNLKLLIRLGVNAAVYPTVTVRGVVVLEAPKPGRLVLTKVRPGLTAIEGACPYLTNNVSLPPRNT